MIVQGHWVRNYLHTIVKAAVMLYVDMTFIGICNFTYLLCISINMTALVYFKFYTKISVAFAVKDRIGFETIIVDILA